MDTKNPLIAIKLATEKWVGKSTEERTDNKKDQKGVNLHRTKELVAQIFRLSQELNLLVNEAGNVSSTVKIN